MLVIALVEINLLLNIFYWAVQHV